MVPHAYKLIRERTIFNYSLDLQTETDKSRDLESPEKVGRVGGN